MSALEDKSEDAPPWGPKMLALSTDKQRAFVCALYDEEAPIKGEGLLIWAARKAGYGNKRRHHNEQIALRDCRSPRA